jgi:hypothetical protein
MLDKCSNPGCLRTFHYFGEGRVYFKSCDCAHVPRGREMSLWPDCPKPLEYFWLCGNCAHKLTLVFDPAGRAVVRPRHALLPAVPPRALLPEAD